LECGSFWAEPKGRLAAALLCPACRARRRRAAFFTLRAQKPGAAAPHESESKLSHSTFSELLFLLA
jgi:hypothetical protein